MSEVPRSQQPAAVTIGVFDGVHRGHQQLVDAAVAAARKMNGRSVMVTFDPHPISVFLPSRPPLQVTSVERRLQLAREAGIDEVLIIDFTKELSGLDPRGYAQVLLAEALGARYVVVGENFSFGAEAAGTPQMLAEYGREFGFEVEIPKNSSTTRGINICSTNIRDALARGDVRSARWALGRPFSVHGPVVRGAGRGGKELGFPTANQYFADTMALPADGVYAGWLTISQRGARVDGDCSRGLPMPQLFRWVPTQHSAMRSAPSNPLCSTGKRISTVTMSPWSLLNGYAA